MIDLTNKTVTTISNCDQEPIHVPGTIQAHGYLLAINPQDGTVTHCSRNLTRFLQLPLQEILGRNILHLFPQHRDVLEERLGEKGQSSGLTLRHDDVSYHMMTHRSAGLIILELEPAVEDHPETITVPELLSLIKTPGSLVDLCDTVAKEVRRILGYDRVMIYRFDTEDHSGEVIAECLADGMEPYLGLRYPAGDIPLQARALYVRNTIRSINDTGSEPVALFTQPGDGTGTVPEQLDLSYAYLRSVSPIHIQYLRNMGVGASFSISLVKDGQLWGLIACHHRTAHHPTLGQRNTAQMIGILLSSQIELLERMEQSAESLATEKQLNALLHFFEDENRFGLPALVEKPELLRMAEAWGVAIVVMDKIYSKGLTPPSDATLRLVEFLRQSSFSTKGFSTKNLAAHYPAAKAIEEVASGIIYHPLDFASKDCIVWFRPGLVQTVTWGGQPDSRQPNNSKGTLTPRSSFSAWQQTVRDVSEPWSDAQVQITARLAFALRKQLRTLHIQQESDQQRALNERLMAVNEELENINWISSHDLREPLRKIQVLASRALSKDSHNLSEVLLDSINRMQVSARRMQQLLDDISAYSNISAKQNVHAEVDLNSLVQEIFIDKADVFREQQAELKVEELPEIVGIAFQLKQLFLNLITNSLKFSRPDEPNLISIQVTSPTEEAIEAFGITAQNYFSIVLRDRGVGFDPAYSRTIFKLFQRLNNEPDGKNGTGVGLAICKKVMHNHEGLIWAESTLGVGSAFYLIFPNSRLL
ncbi:ATP-binding protein [Persicitalea jodogahamensis]|uniref:histidine kinase n=1 Tax=Persicitalea jodogahamensis TaxID=402147 RepID=A0A8J3D771_9BACT|nr:ATP-binding protein [Persicitalea jodogahamensis]GHB63249.1 histidine kinase [Persicitalea jodogahamensis]